MSAMLAASIVPFACALLQAGAAPAAAPSESQPVQFALRNDAMKQHATVVNNELTVSAGVNEPYLSSVKVGDFEATGEIAIPSDSRATLHVYATVDENARAHRRMEIVLPPSSNTGWQPMTVSALDGHVRVTISGRVIAEREVVGERFGLFGFEVSTGQLSLRNWRVARRDLPSSAPAPTESRGIVDARRLPPNAQLPRLVHEVKPRYTEGAMRRKVQGVVDIEAVVEVDGSVRPVRVTRSQDEDLDVQALDALKQWTFEPALLEGRPVPCMVTVELTFVLRGR
jgi:TonB family protein